MVGLAFWVSGQFFLTRAATLLVFADIWALVKGTNRYRAGVPDPSARLELTDLERPRNPGWDPRRMSTAWLRLVRAASSIDTC